MSANSSPSPWQRPTNPVDESQLPQGHCRFILLLPEVRGQRCACVNFTLNKGIPGATCDCGHLACYHSKDPETPEADQLNRRLQALEDRLASNDDQVARRSSSDDDAYDNIIARLSEVEYDLERSKDEFNQEIKRSYTNSTPLWGSYQLLKYKVHELEAQLRHANQRFTEVDNALRRLDNRQLELLDADAFLEEKVDGALGSMEQEIARLRPQVANSRQRRRSMSDNTSRPPTPPAPSAPPESPQGGHLPSTRPRPRRRKANGGGRSSDLEGPRSASSASSYTSPPADHALTRLVSEPAASGTWTVHISLMPHPAVAMPFERNTNAYQRCLSRGLHQVVPVHGPSAEAFHEAVTKAFGALLKDRPWMPLQARLCDAAPLIGLPMLRQLGPELIEQSYDADFLRNHCAVCDGNGTIDSLYIAVREPRLLSWGALKRAPIVVEGLEESWGHDRWLDKESEDEKAAVGDEQPAAGAIMPAIPSLKRTASEMARSNSLGSATTPAAESTPSRAKRSCPLPSNTMLSIRRPGMGTV